MCSDGPFTLAGGRAAPPRSASSRVPAEIEAGSLPRTGPAMVEEAVFLIPYRLLYNGALARFPVACIVGIAVLVGLFFYIMYVVAERHFARALQYLARMLSLSQEITGVTLLAFGNGAPDFFTSLCGAEEKPVAIISGSIGSGLFILTVVFGMVIIFAKRAPEGGPAMAAVGEEGEERTAGGAQSCIPELSCAKEGAPRISRVPFLRSASVYIPCVVLLGVFSVASHIPYWLPLLLLLLYVAYLATLVAIHLMGVAMPKEPTVVSVIVDGRDIYKERMGAAEHFGSLSMAAKLCFALRHTLWEGRAAGALRVPWLARRVAAVLIAPVTLALNLLILPMEDSDEYELTGEQSISLKFLHRLRCLVAPFASLALLGVLLLPAALLRSHLVWGLYICLATSLSIGMWLTTRWGERPRLFRLHIAQAFVMSICCIYATSKELICCLCFVGNVLGIPDDIMGLTVLAWGNSIGDLVADVAIAKSGGLDTAAVAIFSGPIQNVLLSLGMAFANATLRTSDWQVSVDHMYGYTLLALALLLLVLALCLVAIPFVLGYRLPRRFGVLLIAIYIVYLPCAIMLWSLDVKGPHLF